MRATAKRFHEELRLIGLLHDQKQADYGAEGDPFANVRAAEDFGVPGWVGCAIRGNDKMRRLMKAARLALRGMRVRMRNESVRDSFQDLAVYAIIGLLLYDEATGNGRTKKRKRRARR